MTDIADTPFAEYYKGFFTAAELRAFADELDAKHPPSPAPTAAAPAPREIFIDGANWAVRDVLYHGISANGDPGQESAIQRCEIAAFEYVQARPSLASRSLQPDAPTCNEDTHYWPEGSTPDIGTPCSCGEKEWPGDLAQKLRDAESYIEQLRGPLLYYFGTTDPELLADVWKDQSRRSVSTGDETRDREFLDLLANRDLATLDLEGPDWRVRLREIAARLASFTVPTTDKL